MRAGTIASAYGRSGRHLRFIALASALIIIDISLWVRVMTQNAATIGDTAFATIVATSAIIAMLALWRRPLDRNTRMMATPALRQMLATHHAGHVVAAYINDPAGVSAIDISEPCSRHSSLLPAVTQSMIRAELVNVLAGMSAEEIFAGESGAHVEQDLASATTLGADMVGRFGMSGSLVSLNASRPSRNTFVERVLDDAQTRKGLESILRESKRESVRLMLENRQAIVSIREALMRNHRLSAPQINEILSQVQETRNHDDEVLVDLRVMSKRTRPIASVSQS
ncbi:MAG: hypothetical protein GY788_19765 [bacterium]|nr:hypothetical protein [bacterium]